MCNPNPRDKTEDGRYRIACPCDVGLSCQFKDGASMVRVVLLIYYAFKIFQKGSTLKI